MSRFYDRRYHVRRSAPVGRIVMTATRKIAFGRRMKPKSWTTDTWFKSALFERGMTSRKRRFRAILALQSPPAKVEGV
jgi:hypothetical protein